MNQEGHLVGEEEPGAESLGLLHSFGPHLWAMVALSYHLSTEPWGHNVPSTALLSSNCVQGATGDLKAS